MSPENQKKLSEKYYFFFQHLEKNNTPMMDPDKPILESVSKLIKQEQIVVPMQFGFECEDGWYFLLDQLMGSIKWHLDQENKRRDREPKKKWMDKISWKLRIKTKAKRKLLRKLGEWIYNNQPRGVAHMFFQIDQIKEKFGELCFYYSGGDDQIDRMVNLVESMSYSTCESCGSTKNVGQTQGWIYTVCGNCREKNPRIKEKEWKLNED